MERTSKRFKRTIKSEPFKNDIKKQMNILRFQKRTLPFKEEMLVQFIKRSKLYHSIQALPEEIQTKVYIFAMRGYWKDKLLSTPLKPMWCDYKAYMNNEIRKCLFDNIHFMHLECNTLEKNKEWIPGCQCTFCLNDTKVTNKDIVYQMMHDEGSESQSTALQEFTHCYDIDPNIWNCYMKYPNNLFVEDDEICPAFKIFDALKFQFGDVFAQIYLSPHDSPIYFSNEIEE